MSSKSASMDRSSREAKLEAIKKQNAAEKRRQRMITIITVAVIAVLVAAVAIVIAIAAQQESEQASGDPANLVTVENADGQQLNGFAVGPQDADVTVTLVEDYLCPACKQFEEQAGPFIEALPEDDVRVVRVPVTFLAGRFQGDYSERAASAAACVASTETDPELPVFLEFTRLLFANQPAETTGTAPTSEELAEFAGQAGASDAMQACITDDTYQGWSERQNTGAQQAGVGGTPTVWVNGVPTENFAPETIQAAIDAARGGEPEAEPTG
jgi:protein-disulfide isomerase